MQKNHSAVSKKSGIGFQPVVPNSQSVGPCRPNTEIRTLKTEHRKLKTEHRSLNTEHRTLKTENYIAICSLFLCFMEWNFISNTSIAQQVFRQRIGLQRADAEEADDEAPDAAAIRGALPRMNRQQMEEYMYGSLGGSKAAFHKLKRESIRRELDRVHSICNLTDEQWSKLNEAIDLDIQHVENRITTLLSGYDGKMTPQLLQEMQQKVWQFTSSMESNKTDRNAIWHKVLMSQLTKEQSKLIEFDDAKKRANLARTSYLRHLLSLQRKLGLSSDQRSKLEVWLSQDRNQEADFLKLCAKIERSVDAAEILSSDQLKSLKEFPAVPIQPPVLPMRVIMPIPIPAIQAPVK